MEQSNTTPNTQIELAVKLKELDPIRYIWVPKNDELMIENRLINEQIEKVLPQSTLSEDVKTWLKKGVVKYIESPTILDNFKDDNLRDEFEETLIGQDFYDFYKSNRLRRNNINDVIRFLSEFKLFQEEFNFSANVMEKLKEIYSMVSSKQNEPDFKPGNFQAYEKMGIEKKLDVTHKVTELAREICREVIQKFS